LGEAWGLDEMQHGRERTREGAKGVPSMRESFDSGGESRFEDHDSASGKGEVSCRKDAITGILL